MKKINLIAFSFLVGLFMTVNVNAQEVDTSAELLDCIKTDGNTCTLTQNIDLNERFVVDTGKNIVLDLNEKILNVEYVIENNYSVFVKGNLTIQGNGTINISNNYGIAVTGTLVIKNGTFNHEEGTYLIGNWGGTTTIENGSFNADYCAVNVFSGNVKVENGIFNANPYPAYDSEDETLYYFSMLADDGASLEIKKGTFNHILSWPNVLTDDAEVTYNLEKENVIYDSIEVKGNVTLNLNGQTVSFDENFIESGEDSVFTVLRGGKLTINDSKGTGKILAGDSGKVYSAIKMTKKGETETGDIAELVVNNGTLEGFYYAIVGNGNRHDTRITINNGTIKGTNPVINLGIFHPQKGDLTINGGTITGVTGIEMRAGNLVVNDGVITGTGTELKNQPNGSGSTTYGAGIGISQHTTAKEINVTINGGTIKGKTAIYQVDPQQLGESGHKNVSVKLVGGNYEAINDGTTVVYSENKTNFISGGVYSIEPNSKYVVSPYIAKKDGEVYKIVLNSEEISSDVTEVDTKKEVTEVTVGVSSEDKKEFDNVLLDSLNAKSELIVGVTEEVEVKLEFNTENVSNAAKELIEKTLNDENLQITHFFDANVNVYVGGSKVGELTELTSSVKLTVMLPEKLQETAKGYTRKFYILREHNDEVEKLEAKLSEDGKYLTVETDKFSTYAIAYEDVEKVIPPKTGDNVVTYVVVCLIALLSFVACGLFLKKRLD